MTVANVSSALSVRGGKEAGLAPDSEAEMSGVIPQPGVHRNSAIWSGVGMQSMKEKIQPPENKKMVFLKSAFLS